MMKLFIKIENGVPFEHPITENNFKQVFPDIDINNLPPEFAEFRRVERPPISQYEVYEDTTYEKSGDVYIDVHHVRAMTPEERATTDAFIASVEAELARLMSSNNN